jgi:hypothetical protein
MTGIVVVPASRGTVELTMAGDPPAIGPATTALNLATKSAGVSAVGIDYPNFLDK